MTASDRTETASSTRSGASLVSSYAAAVASGEPAPGGGSVAAVIAALAAALVEMVGHLSFGRAGSATTEALVQPALASAAALRARLLELAAADEAAYRGYIAATKLPKTTDAEKSARRQTLQAALTQAAEVPLAVATACHEVLDVLDPLAEHGNRHAVSDVIVAAMSADVAARAALLNVRVNAKSIKDEARATSYLEAATSLEQSSRDRAGAIIATATRRL